jgi:hypothetical protein
LRRARTNRRQNQPAGADLFDDGRREFRGGTGEIRAVVGCALVPPLFPVTDSHRRVTVARRVERPAGPLGQLRVVLHAVDGRGADQFGGDSGVVATAGPDFEYPVTAA